MADELTVENLGLSLLILTSDTLNFETASNATPCSCYFFRMLGVLFVELVFFSGFVRLPSGVALAQLFFLKSSLLVRFVTFLILFVYEVFTSRGDRVIAPLALN